MNAKKTVAMAVFALGAGFAYSDTVVVPEVTDVTMEQTGNKVMTITYKLKNGPAVVTLDVETNYVDEAGVTRWTSIGGNHLRLFKSSSEVFRKIEAGDVTHTIKWQPDIDWGDHSIPAGGARAVVTAWAMDNTPDYMVVDLVSSNDIRYYPAVEFLPGGLLENDDYRLSKLVMRKIMAKDVPWMMGATAEKAGYAKKHAVTMEHNYYIGVFEVTQMQYGQFVKESWGSPKFPSYFRGTDREKMMRPVENIDYSVFRGCKFWHDTPSDTSFLGLIRAKTGLDDLDLPSNAQWEFACRAGHGEGRWGTGEDYTASLDNVPGRYAGNSHKDDISPYEVPDQYNPHNDAPAATMGTAIVGSYKQNSWGLYDMHGNVGEFVLDFYYDGCFSPDGAVAERENESSVNHFVRGGSWNDAADLCCSSYAPLDNVTYGGKQKYLGFRLACRAGLK